VESAICIFARRVLPFFGPTRLKVAISPIFLSGAPVLINRRVNLGLTRGNREGGREENLKIGELSVRGILQSTTDRLIPQLDSREKQLFFNVISLCLGGLGFDAYRQRPPPPPAR